MFRVMAVVLAVSAGLPLPGVEFNRDIRPVLSERCFTCHGPDNNNRKAGLRLDQEAAAKAELRPGHRPITSGDPTKSQVFLRIASTNKALRMPPAYAGHEAMPANEVALIKQWIEEGAAYQNHWSLIPPRRDAGQTIDSLVRARLAQSDLRMSAEAGRPTLLRRLSFDLTGLPPSPREVDEFLNDRSANAYEKVVDRLLASARYAERMAIRWLEAARYADTNGYQSDGERSMWRWRDWVLQAFQSNMPFDRFTIEQIAGDLLPNATTQQRIASGFHRNHRTNAEGGIVEEEFRVEYVADRVETTATVWMGLTLGCTRCHDHKYDPFTQKEYYQLFAFYNNVPERGLVYNFGNEEPYLKAPTPEHEKKLAALDAAQRQAEQNWSSLQSRIAADQIAWEKSLASSEPLHWSVRDGLVLHLTNDKEMKGKIPYAAGQDVAKFNYMDPFTLAAWIKPSSPNGTIVSKAEDYFEGEGYQLFLMDGRLRLHVTRRFTDISLRMESVEPVKLNEWSHVAVTSNGRRKGAGFHFYIDGKPVATKILFDELTYPYGPKEPFRVGQGAGDKYRYQGEIDDVRAYRIELTREQVSTLPLKESIQELAAIPLRARSDAQRAKLRLCFLDRGAAQEIRDVRSAMQAAQAERMKYYDSIPTVMVMVENEKPRDTFLLKRGAYDAPGERVFAKVPAVLPALPRGAPANRLGLARWLVDRSHPLTARVTVNRFWQMLFGTGLVKTVEDFGSQGEWPVYADLLDWLAVEFMDSGWDMRHTIKTIVMSQTYRQSSNVTQELLQRDPDNRLLARGPRFRLSHEMIRDNALAVSGLLVEKNGGPSVKPYQPPGLWQELSGGRYVEDKGEGLYRRSLYTYWKRTVAPPAMINFDSPTRESCIVRESRTNTPLQALTLMNDVTYMEAARKLAERILREGGASASERIRYGFRLVTARAPRANEASALAALLDQLQSRYRGDAAAAEKYLKQGQSTRDPALPVTELAAYTGVSSLLLNLDEAVTKE
ncbi:MAG: DUF1553 domain-containing protein [Acidobacteria bacterium]|nr:DUF1553 domain-containing protein [Acidobacteriota bacterium]